MPTIETPFVQETAIIETETRQYSRSSPCFRGDTRWHTRSIPGGLICSLVSLFILQCAHVSLSYLTPLTDDEVFDESVILNTSNRSIIEHSSPWALSSASLKGIILFLLTSFLMVTTYLKSPGRVHMNPDASPTRMQTAIDPIKNQAYNQDLERWQRIASSRALSEVDPYIYRTCGACLHDRPLRSKHCYVCGRCILKFDHYCQMLSTCIGLRNYRFFILLLMSLTAWMTFLVIDTIRIVTRSSTPNLLRYWLVSWLIGLIAVLSLLVIYVIFHIRLISINATTNEDDRQIYGHHIYPFNRGFIANWTSFINGSNF